MTTSQLSKRTKRDRRASRRRRSISLRDRNSHAFSTAPVIKPFKRFAKAQLLGRFSFGRRKVKEKERLATQMLHQLVLAGNAGGCVADSRNSHQRGVRLRVQVWDAIESTGLLTKQLGSEKSGKVTRYAATTKLLELFKDWRLGQLVDLRLFRNSRRKKPTRQALVCIHTGTKDPETGKKLPKRLRKKPLPLPRKDREAMDVIRRNEDLIERINAQNARHSWLVRFVDEQTGMERQVEPNFFIRQVMTRRLGNGGRLYSWGHLNAQRLPTSMRKTMLLDREPVVELDFAAHAIRCLYHQKGLDPPGDLYRPKRIFRKSYCDDSLTTGQKRVVRRFVKKVTNALLNAKSPAEANSVAGHTLHKHPNRRLLNRLIRGIEESDTLS